MWKWYLVTLAMKITVAPTVWWNSHATFIAATQPAMQKSEHNKPRIFTSAPSTATLESLWWQFYDRRQQHDKLITLTGKEMIFFFFLKSLDWTTLNSVKYNKNKFLFLSSGILKCQIKHIVFLIYRNKHWHTQKNTVLLLLLLPSV